MDTSNFETKKLRGFALLDSATRREISRKGGMAAWSAGKAHRFTSDEARVAGAKARRKTDNNNNLASEV